MSEFMPMAPRDVSLAFAMAPKVVRDVLEQHARCDTAPYAVLAGGALRASVAREPVADYDVFLSDATAARALAMGLDGDHSESDRAFTIRTGDGIVVQVIREWSFQDPEALLSGFDFSVARAAIYVQASDGIICGVVGKTFYEDLASRRLTYFPDGTRSPGGSIARVLRFGKMGYSIDKQDLGTLLARFAVELEHGPSAAEAGEAVAGLAGRIIPLLGEPSAAGRRS